MIFIAAYWLFLFFLVLPLGILTGHVLKISSQNTFITLLLGLVLLTCGFTLTAFFFPLGAASLIFWLIVSLTSGIYYKLQIRKLLKSFGESLKQLPSYLKVVVSILIFGTLLKSAQYPFITDNESYYIQTIKWLNKYGFVKGLANLHIFLAQNSAWHVLQAGINLSFLTNKINDINGFVFILCSVYCITEGQAYSTPKKRYWLSFTPLLSLFPFLFLDVPSPDLPLLVITPIILHLYIQHNENNSNFRIALLLFIFLVSIKLTVLPLGILFLAGLTQKQNLKFALFTGTPIALLWIAKNIIISGYPLYPIALFKTGYDWAVPDNAFKLIIDLTADYGYKRSAGLLPKDITMAAKLLYWLQQDGLAGIINKLTLALLFCMPFSMLKDKRHKMVYAALLINFLAILFTSPQFRYFLYITYAGCLFVAAAFFNYIKANAAVYKIILILGTLTACITFLNFGLNKLTTNKRHQAHGIIKVQQLYLPEDITKYPDLKFVKVKLGNLNYYSPEYNFFMYGTANGPLPCVNTKQINFMQRELGIIPQLRTGDIKDGFYSATTPHN